MFVTSKLTDLGLPMESHHDLSDSGNVQLAPKELESGQTLNIGVLPMVSCVADKSDISEAKAKHFLAVKAMIRAEEELRAANEAADEAARAVAILQQAADPPP